MSSAPFRCYEPVQACVCVCDPLEREIIHKGCEYVQPIVVIFLLIYPASNCMAVSVCVCILVYSIELDSSLLPSLLHKFALLMKIYMLRSTSWPQSAIYLYIEII